MKIHRKFFHGLTPVLAAFVSACSINAHFIPDNGELNDARIGENYYAKVYIKGGRVIDMSVYSYIEPGELGLYAQPCEHPEGRISKETGLAKDYGCIEVRGVPVGTGRVELKVYGALVGKERGFENSFTINIKE